MIAQLFKHLFHDFKYHIFIINQQDPFIPLGRRLCGDGVYFGDNRVLEREINLEFSSFARFAEHLDISPVVLNNTMHNRESHSRAFS